MSTSKLGECAIQAGKNLRRRGLGSLLTLVTGSLLTSMTMTFTNKGRAGIGDKSDTAKLLHVGTHNHCSHPQVKTGTQVATSSKGSLPRSDLLYSKAFGGAPGWGRLAWNHHTRLSTCLLQELVSFPSICSDSDHPNTHHFSGTLRGRDNSALGRGFSGAYLQGCK